MPANEAKCGALCRTPAVAVLLGLAVLLQGCTDPCAGLKGKDLEGCKIDKKAKTKDSGRKEYEASEDAAAREDDFGDGGGFEFHQREPQAAAVEGAPRLDMKLPRRDVPPALLARGSRGARAVVVSGVKLKHE